MVAFPTTPLPTRAEFDLEWNTQAFTSPLNKATQTSELPGALWAATLGFDDVKGAERRALRSFLRSLKGADGRFDLWDHSHPTPVGAYDSGSDTPLVMGAGQTGASLDTDGWRVDGTGLLLVGDYFEVTAGGSKRLCEVEADVDSDGSGEATITFHPPLTVAPDDNAPLVFVRPSAVFRLLGDDLARALNTGNRSTFTIDCIEAF